MNLKKTTRSRIEQVIIHLELYLSVCVCVLPSGAAILCVQNEDLLAVVVDEN